MSRGKNMFRRLVATICAVLMVANGLVVPGIAAPALETANVEVSRVGATTSEAVCPSISQNGNLIAFVSAQRLSDEDVGNDWTDVYVYDVSAGTYELITKYPTDGSTRFFSDCYYADISADGNWVAFLAWSGVQGEWETVYVYDRANKATHKVGPVGKQTRPSISGDGRLVVYSNAYNIYLSERMTDGDSTKYSDPQMICEGYYPDISSSGNRIAFTRGAPISHVYVYDLELQTEKQLDPNTSSSSQNARVNTDGSYISFESENDLTDAGVSSWQVYRYNYIDGTISIVSLSDSGAVANDTCGLPVGEGWGSSISEDGNYVTFASYADNLVAGDTNLEGDIFVRDVAAGTTIRISSITDQMETIYGIHSPVISDISTDKARVAFVMEAFNDNVRRSNVYFADITAGQASLQITADPSLTEGNLDGAIIRATVAGDRFSAEKLAADLFTALNAPAGTSIAEVVQVDESVVDIKLAFDGTDFDLSILDFRISVGGDALISGNPLTSNSLAIEAGLERGTVSLSQSSYVVTEGEVLTVTVVRTGGSDGFGMVAYSVFAGTATAGQDYDCGYSTSGSLEFEDGETSKSFDIAIIDDSDSEAAETFSIWLFRGEVELPLGLRDATVTINDNDSATIPALIAHDITASTSEDTATAITLLATGSSGAVNYVIVDSTSNGAIAVSDNIATYTPDPDFFGTDSFTYKAVEGALESNIATVSITVNAVNDPPVITTVPNQTNTENDTVSIPVTVTDVDDTELSFSATKLPGGVDIDPATGLITGTLADGSAGEYKTTITVSDGEATISSSFDWTVAPVVTPLALTNTNLPNATSGEAYSHALGATGGTAPYTFTTDSALPSGLSLGADGLLSGTPAESGVFEIVVTVQDSTGATAAATCSLTVGQIVVPDTTAPYWPGDSVLTCSNVGQDSVTISWPAALDNVGVTAYRVSEGDNRLAEVGAEQLSYQVTGLSPLNTYYFSVLAGDAAGNWTLDGLDGWVTTAAAVEELKAPDGLQLTVMSSRRIDLKWTDNSDNEDGFVIERSRDGVLWTEVGQTDKDVSSYSDTSLKSSTTYYYRVFAYNASSKSEPCDMQKATTRAAVVAPVIYLSSIDLSVSTTALTAGGDSAALQATAKYSDGSTADVTRIVSWQISDPSIVSISGAEVVPLAEGTATIRASLNGHSASVMLAVSRPRILQLSTVEEVVYAGGETMSLQATLVEPDGSTSDVTDLCNWSVSDATKAAAVQAGHIRPLVGGAVTVTATLGELSGERQVDIVGVQSIAIDPPAVNLVVGQTPSQFTATVLYSDGSSRSATADVSWSLSRLTLARLVGRGLVEPRQAGTVDLTATLGGLSESVSIGITELTLTPPSATLFLNPPEGILAGMDVRDTIQLQAALKSSDGSSQDISAQAMWSSSDEGVASVSPAGVVMGLKQGLTKITVTYNDISATAVLWVLDELTIPNIKMLAAWDNPSQVLLRWAVKGDWLPPEGLDLYRVVTLPDGQEVVSRVANVGSQVQLRQATIDVGGVAMPLWDITEQAVLTPEKLADLSLGLPSDPGNALDPQLIEEAIAAGVQLPSELTINTGEASFRGNPTEFSQLFSPAQPMQPAATQPVGVQSTLLATQTVGSIEAPVLDSALSNPVIEGIRDARRWIQTAANVDMQFAELSGLGYIDTVSYNKQLQGTPVTYYLSPAGVPLELLLEAGLDLPNASVQLGVPKLPAQPIGLDGYGMDGEVQLRWDIPADAAANSTHVSGYNIERKLAGETAYTKVNDKPIVIALTKNEMGGLDEPSVFYTDQLPDGTIATYRVRSLNIFGQESLPSSELTLEVVRTIPPATPALQQPILDVDVAAAWQGLHPTATSQLNIPQPAGLQPVNTIDQRLAASIGVPPFDAVGSARYIAVPFIQGNLHGAAEYRIYRSKAEGAGEFGAPHMVHQFTGDTLGDRVKEINQTQSMFLSQNGETAKQYAYYDTDVQPGFYYKYWVSTVDDWNNESAWSNSLTVGCPALQPPLPVTNVQASFTPADNGLVEINSSLGVLRGKNNPPGFMERLTIGETEADDDQPNDSTGSATSMTELQPFDQVYNVSSWSQLQEQWNPHKLIAVTPDDLNPDGTLDLTWEHAPVNEGINYRIFFCEGPIQIAAKDPLAGTIWSSAKAWHTAVNRFRVQAPVFTDTIYFLITTYERTTQQSVQPEELSSGAAGGYVTVTWNTGNAPQVRGYSVYRAEVKAQGTDLTWVLVGSGVQDNSYTEQVDQSRVRFYRYRVLAHDVWGQESTATTGPQVRIPTTLPPEAPQMLVSRPNAGSVTIRWTPVADAAHYIVYRTAIPVLSVEQIQQLVSQVEQLTSEQQTGDLTEAEIIALQQKMSKMTAEQQAELLGQIMQQYGVLAAAPYGRLDKESAKQINWQPIATLSFQSLGSNGFRMVNGALQWVDQVSYPNKYLYTVAAVNADKLISALPDPVSGEPRKGNPPAAPVLRVQSSTEAPVLSWNAYVPNSQLADSEREKVGYIVFRSNARLGNYYQISDLLRDASFIDDTAQAGRTYWYTVKTIDEVGLVSKAANPVSGGKQGTIVFQTIGTQPQIDYSIAPFSGQIGSFTIQNIRLYHVYVGNSQYGIGEVTLHGVTVPVQVTVDRSTRDLMSVQLSGTADLQFAGDSDATLTLTSFSLQADSTQAVVAGKLNVGELTALTSPDVEFSGATMASSNAAILGAALPDVRLGDNIFRGCRAIIRLSGGQQVSTGLTPVVDNISTLLSPGISLSGGSMERSLVRLTKPFWYNESLDGWLVDTADDTETTGMQFQMLLPAFISPAGQLTGSFTISDQQISLAVPQQLKVNLTGGTLVIVDNVVDATQSSILGDVELPYQAAQPANSAPNSASGEEEIQESATSGNSLIDKFDFQTITLDTTQTGAAQHQPAQLTEMQQQILAVSLAYALTNAVGSDYLCPDQQGADSLKIPFVANNWDGEGITTQTGTGIAPLCIGGGFMVASPNVVIDLSAGAAPSLERPSPEWLGLVFEDVVLVLPDEFKHNGTAVQFQANQSFFYEQSGLCGYYDSGSDTTGATSVQVDSLLGFPANITGADLDLYRGSLNVELLGDLTVDALGEKQVNYRAIADNKSDVLVMNVIGEESSTQVGTQPLALSVESGRLERIEGSDQGELILNGTITVNNLSGLQMSEPAEFVELRVSPDKTELPTTDTLETVKNPLGNGRFINTPWAKLWSYAVGAYDFQLVTDDSGGTDMLLRGEIQVAGNLPFKPETYGDTIYVENVFTNASIPIEKVKAEQGIDWLGIIEDWAWVLPIGLERMDDGSLRWVNNSFYTTDLPFKLLGHYLDDEYLKGDLQFSAGRDENGMDFWVVAIKGGRGLEDSDIEEKKKELAKKGEILSPEEEANMRRKIKIGPVSFRNFLGVLAHNIDLPEDLSEVTNETLSVFARRLPVKEGESYLLAKAELMEVSNILSARNAQIIISSGPTVRIIGEQVKVTGVPMKDTNIYVMYQYPSTMQASTSFKDLTLPFFDVGSLTGSLGFLASPERWNVMIGYPETLVLRVPGDPTLYGLGVGFESREDGWQGMAKVLLGFEVTKLFGSFYVEAYVTATGEVVVEDANGQLQVLGRLIIEAGGMLGMYFENDKNDPTDDAEWEIAHLAVRLIGELEGPDPLRVMGAAEIYYQVNLEIWETEGTIPWDIEYVKP